MSQLESRRSEHDSFFSMHVVAEILYYPSTRKKGRGIRATDFSALGRWIHLFPVHMVARKVVQTIGC